MGFPLAFLTFEIKFAICRSLQLLTCLLPCPRRPQIGLLTAIIKSLTADVMTVGVARDVIIHHVRKLARHDSTISL